MSEIVNHSGRFQKGNPGRPLGATNHFNRVLKTCEAMNFDPLVEAIRRYRDPDTPNASKDYCLGIVADRLLPKLKAVEHTVTGQDARQVLINIIAGESNAPAPSLDAQAHDLVSDQTMTVSPTESLWHDQNVSLIVSETEGERSENDDMLAHEDTPIY